MWAMRTLLVRCHSYCKQRGESWLNPEDVPGRKNWHIILCVSMSGFDSAVPGGRMKLSVQHVLITYSAVLSTTFAVVLLTGAKSYRNQTFDEIQVHRVDVVEPDGTLRMVISDRDRMPGVVVKGKESPNIDR